MHFRKILGIKLREIGDAVIWTSALQSLRSAFPDASIDVLVRDSVEPVLDRQPWIDRVHTVSRETFPLARRLLALRAEKYDLALGFSATNTLCRLIPLLGAPHRVLYHVKRSGDPRFSTFPLPELRQNANAIDHDHRVVRALGVEGEPPPPTLVLSDGERVSARDRLLSFFPDLGSRDIALVGLLPGARADDKIYPKDLWLRVLDGIVEARPRVPVAVLVDRDLSTLWNMRQLCEERNVPLFDDLGLRELMEMLSWMSVVVCNDSGPKHIAVALGARSVTLYGPTKVEEWHPYDLTLHPVFRETDMRQIDPEQVWRVTSELLGGI
jgi:heptosyltransferase-3